MSAPRQLFIKTFQQLSNEELYKLLRLRFEVFVLEQECLYEEFDDIDYKAIHFFIQEREELIGYLRLYRKDDQLISIGRIVVAISHRSQGVAKNLLQECLAYIKVNFPAQRIIISAQLHLQKYYEQFGFEHIGKPYDDAGIMHTDMIKVL